MIRRLLQPTPELLDDPSPGKIAATAAITSLCLAVYGFTVGCWRAPDMGLWVAIKMPLLIACTLVCNGLLNGMMGLLLGGLGFRQSWLALLSCFATASLILASLSPITFLMALQFPDPDSPQAVTAHAAHEIFHVSLIAISGIAGTLTLYRILKARCATPLIARTTLGTWLLGNGVLGAQFSWIFRPFFGTPGLPVVFMWPNPMQGGFYDSVWKSLRRLMGGENPVILLIFVLLAALCSLPLLIKRHLSKHNLHQRP